MRRRAKKAPGLKVNRDASVTLIPECEGLEREVPDSEGRHITLNERVPLCDRLVQHNSLRWSCACGAAGPVGRSADGIPYVDDEMLRHEPGATKE